MRQQDYLRAGAKTVLIADDTPFFRAALKDILHEDGAFQVIAEAVNGAEAVEKAILLKPDIIILDIEMPVKNGLEAALEISRLRLKPKIVMCSSLEYEQVVREALRRGASAYIHKPLSSSNVLSVLKSL